MASTHCFAIASISILVSCLPAPLLSVSSDGPTSTSATATIGNRDQDTGTCSMNLPSDASIDFVIDIHISPKNDRVNKDFFEQGGCLANGQKEHAVKDGSDAFFDSIAAFIDAVSAILNPSQTYSVIVDNGDKFFINGKTSFRRPAINSINGAGRKLSDDGFKPLWPQSAINDGTCSLGERTKMALLARESGLPIVLHDKKTLSTAYAIIITDGWSATPPSSLTTDTSRSTMFSLGKRAVYQNLTYADIMQYANIVQLDCPQHLSNMVTTTQYLLCLIAAL